MSKKQVSETEKINPDTGTAYDNYVTTEASLLEQIRAKEEEQNARIDAARQQYIRDIENARKEADALVARSRAVAQTEADTIWQEAMDRINRDVEKILGEGEQVVRHDRERKEQRFSSVVERIHGEIVKG